MKRDSLIAVCAVRAVHAHANDVVAAGRDPNALPSKGEKMRALWESTTVGSKVAGFILLWAIALDELDTDELGVEAMAEWSNEGRTTVYRRLTQFRRLFPEYDTPNELARDLVEQARRRRERPSLDSPVLAERLAPA